VLLLCFIFAAGRPAAAATGPTLQFDYGRGNAPDNSISEFIVFCAAHRTGERFPFSPTPAIRRRTHRVFRCQTNGTAFLAFAISNSPATVPAKCFRPCRKIERRAKELAAGDTLAHQLDSINVEGSGSGSVQITGTLTTRADHHEVRLQFNRHGHASPVSIGLVDICRRDGKVRLENAATARVNTLVFRNHPARQRWRSRWPR